MAVHKLDRKLWLTADKTRVVEDGDEAAAFLLGPEGAEIPLPEAERLGLTGKAAAKAVAEPPEDKAVSLADAENKSGRAVRERGR